MVRPMARPVPFLYLLSPILETFIFRLSSGSKAENDFGEINFELRELGVLNIQVWTKCWIERLWSNALTFTATRWQHQMEVLREL
jgi:hypothetical protein